MSALVDQTYHRMGICLALLYFMYCARALSGTLGESHLAGPIYIDGWICGQKNHLIMHVGPDLHGFYPRFLSLRWSVLSSCSSWFSSARAREGFVSARQRTPAPSRLRVSASASARGEKRKKCLGEGTTRVGKDERVEQPYLCEVRNAGRRRPCFASSPRSIPPAGGIFRLL